jgi:hypothetical protein
VCVFVCLCVCVFAHGRRISHPIQTNLCIKIAYTTGKDIGGVALAKSTAHTSAQDARTRAFFQNAQIDPKFYTHTLPDIIQQR